MSRFRSLLQATKKGTIVLFVQLRHSTGIELVLSISTKYLYHQCSVSCAWNVNFSSHMECRRPGASL